MSKWVENPEVSDFYGTPIIVGATVVYNSSGRLHDGSVTRVQSKQELRYGRYCHDYKIHILERDKPEDGKCAVVTHPHSVYVLTPEAKV